MRYLGGKVRKAKRIADLCEDVASLLGGVNTYVEPFVGGASLFAASCHRYETAIAADLQPDLIAFWNAVSEGWIPPADMKKDLYDELRKTQPGTKLCAWAAYAVSYNGKRFAGYGPKASGRDYVAESVRSTLKKRAAFAKGSSVSFVVSSYESLDIPAKSIVLADPPYAGTTGYGQAFDSNAFWKWASKLSNEGVPVLVTEYTIPDDWVVIDDWSRKSTVDSKKTRERVEVVAVHKAVGLRISSSLR